MALFGHKGQKGSVSLILSIKLLSILERREVASDSGVSKCFKGISPVGRDIQVKTPDEQEAARLTGRGMHVLGRKDGVTLCRFCGEVQSRKRGGQRWEGVC